MIYHLPLPTNFNLETDDAGSVHRWLDQNECTPEYVSIINADSTLMLEIKSDIDPAPYLDMFPTTQPPSETADMQALLAEMNTMQQKLDALLALLGGD